MLCYPLPKQRRNGNPCTLLQTFAASSRKTIYNTYIYIVKDFIASDVLCIRMHYVLRRPRMTSLNMMYVSYIRIVLVCHVISLYYDHKIDWSSWDSFWNFPRGIAKKLPFFSVISIVDGPMGCHGCLLLRVHEAHILKEGNRLADHLIVGVHSAELRMRKKTFANGANGTTCVFGNGTDG